MVRDLLSDRVARYGGGTLLGAVTYWISFLLVYVLADVERMRSSFASGLRVGLGAPLSSVGISPPGSLTYAGWIFYEAHFSATTASVSNSFGRLSETDTMGVGPQTYLHLIPPLLLIGAGLLLARLLRDTDTPSTFTGASIAPGYLLMAVAGAFLFTWSQTAQNQFATATISMHPSLLFAVPVMGLLYPVLCGGLGGFLYTLTRIARL
ncbi:hypothetical protein [Halapricum salinum]|uniref:DUF7978 domain-containing protein n=1 Tax=Halapricum salinum TaxID=1457250 RepID=A0A4D6HGC8_9EURY|nr:hypothetical protein [Halapricum salinum]QCC52701.1 hypothetical protein DV733_16325 [Halapricum salinum]